MLRGTYVGLGLSCVLLLACGGEGRALESSADPTSASDAGREPEAAGDGAPAAQDGSLPDAGRGGGDGLADRGDPPNGRPGAGPTEGLGEDGGIEPQNADSSVTDANGACGNEADLARIGRRTIAQLACEGAACAARALELTLPFSIDADTLQACVGSDAPTLAGLSDGCRACFVAIAQCVPSSCVSVFGGEPACTQAPSSSFEACDAAQPSAGECAECEATRCREAFTECSGLSG